MDKKRFFNFFFWNFRETTRHFPLRSQDRVTGANQNARKLLSTDLVNTKAKYTTWNIQIQNFKIRNKYWRFYGQRKIGNFPLKYARETGSDHL